jgi:energy-converting hydrogenase B subunit D
MTGGPLTELLATTTTTTITSAAQVVALVATGVTATAVVVVRRPARQVVVLSAYGLVLGTLFMTFQAPDVTLSMISVGSIVLPLLLLLALAKMRRQEE